MSRANYSAINHANRARCKISQFCVEFYMVMLLIYDSYIDIHNGKRTYILYTRGHGSILETKDELQSGWLQPCTTDYLLTINWLVLIFAHAPLRTRVTATSFRAIIEKSSSQFRSNDHLQSPPPTPDLNSYRSRNDWNYPCNIHQKWFLLLKIFRPNDLTAVAPLINIIRGTNNKDTIDLEFQHIEYSSKSDNSTSLSDETNFNRINYRVLLIIGFGQRCKLGIGRTKRKW